jgi:hypothetical protein
MNELMTQYHSLVGVGILVGAVVNILKSIGTVKDGQARAWSTGLNLAVLIGIFVSEQMGINLKIYDAQAGELGALVNTAVGLVVQLAGSQVGHTVLKGTPLVGKSFSS